MISAKLSDAAPAALISEKLIPGAVRFLNLSGAQITRDCDFGR